ncbi:MAG TPA: diaminopimelate epimerase [Vicinamibacterales bacterium]|nr:diaminopimelate epimerase [Vicinamibacterales bacterium]
MRVTKAHAYGNDFLLVEESTLPPGIDRPDLARRMCDRHRGIGADGLIVYAEHPNPRTPEHRTTMRLLNADGSRSEVSGNGVRCLAVLLATRHPGARDVVVDTEAGEKRLTLLAREGARYTFRASMGAPTDIRLQTLDVLGSPLDVVTLRVGNPQCVVLGPPTGERLHGIARALATHPAFPEGTNVELAEVERPDFVRILIWERGVGPTSASGTGACAAAVAAAAHGGAARDATIASPGGEQRVEWTDEDLFLTGWAELTMDGEWLAD